MILLNYLYCDEKCRLDNILSWRSTLANPLLYSTLVKRLHRHNPRRYFDYDSIIDTSLEYGEALVDIKRHHPEIQTSSNNNEDEEPD